MGYDAPVIGDSFQRTGHCAESYCKTTGANFQGVDTLANGQACNPPLGGRDGASTHCETNAGTSTCKPRPVCN